jgi:23S rRNA pseudouridine2605 synthase
MRINKYVAEASGLSRRTADRALVEGRIFVNGQPAIIGQDVTDRDVVTLDDHRLIRSVRKTTIMLNKPTGYITSRDGQGSPTIYTLLPREYQQLKPIGRLDKDSTGLLLLTNDGELANRLSHPRYGKQKHYEVQLDKPISSEDYQQLKSGVRVEDYISHLSVEVLDDKKCRVTMAEGKNRQIRRTFDALGYSVVSLHRSQFGDYSLDGLAAGVTRIVDI